MCKYTARHQWTDKEDQLEGIQHLLPVRPRACRLKGVIPTCPTNGVWRPDWLVVCLLMFLFWCFAAVFWHRECFVCPMRLRDNGVCLAGRVGVCLPMRLKEKRMSLCRSSSLRRSSQTELSGFSEGWLGVRAAGRSQGKKRGEGYIPWSGVGTEPCLSIQPEKLLITEAVPPFTAVKLPLSNKHLPFKHLISKEDWCTAVPLISPLYPNLQCRIRPFKAASVSAFKFYVCVLKRRGCNN